MHAQPHWQAEQDQFDLEFEPQQSTRQMLPEHVEALSNYDQQGELDDPIEVDSAPVRGGWNDNTTGGTEVHLDDHELPFDPDEARAFDMGVHGQTGTQQNVSGFDDTELPNFAPPTHQSLTDSHPGSYEDELGVSGSYDPYGTESVQQPFDATAAHTVGQMGQMPDIDEVDVAPPPVQAPPQPNGAARAETNVEDELDTADFYASQGMYAEALEVLRGVLQIYPHHKLVNAKLREIEHLAGGTDAAAPSPTLGAVDYSQGTEALDLDEIEEVSADDFEEVDDLGSGGAPKKKRGPTVMLEKPIDESDADTHYDLGLAYKEMGLYDEAIKAFEKVLRAPGREVQCHIMIGMCHREMGNASEAIQQFKQGLHAEPQERERHSLYYEIAMTYESIQDDGEALYYFEMITKRDPGFADAGQRAEALRQRGAGRNQRHHDDDDI
jgi:tetratricopeptide (TPR) repeat protein